MPTIEKQGVLPENRLFRQRCENCDTIFTFEKREWKEGTGEDAGNEYINCPLPGCGEQCWDYDADEIPVNPTVDEDE